MLYPGSGSGDAFSNNSELMLVVITPSVPINRNPKRSPGTPLFRFTRSAMVNSAWLGCLPPELCTWFGLRDAVRGVGDVRLMMFPAIA